MPQILSEIHQIIAVDRIHFAWSDRLGNVVNGYFEKPDPDALDYFKHHQQQFQEEAGLSFRQALLFGKSVGNFRWPFRSGFEHTRSHEVLFRNLGLEHCLDGVVRDRYGPLGQIFLLRRIGEPDFDEADQAFLAQILPYVAHALANEGVAARTYVETGDSALMIFDHRGRLMYQSAQAKELCLSALPGSSDASWDQRLDRKEMEASLALLFQDTQRAFARSESGHRPPAWNILNQWGEFQVRAYRLKDSGASATESSYGVLLERKTPLEVLLLQRVKEMPLSNRQREVCFLLASGAAMKDIAAMLNIAPTTLKDHARAIYRKLAVGRREELVELILKATSVPGTGSAT
jgi:DNA-binding CsgD family transcriptional regulator